jgi:general stress protein YciG
MIREDDDLQTGHEHAGEHHGEVAPRVAEEKAAEQPRKKARRGFAAMSPEKQKEIASLGGKAAHAKGTAHEFSPEEAREAGRKGGQAAQRARQAKPPSEPTKH